MLLVYYLLIDLQNKPLEKEKRMATVLPTFKAVVVESGTGASSPSRKMKNLKNRLKRRTCLPGYPINVPFNNLQEVYDYLAEERITCLRCGKQYKRLGVHLIKIHNMSYLQYHKFYGIPKNHGLACPDTKKILSNHFKNLVQIRGADVLNEQLKKGREKIKKENIKATPNHLNVKRALKAMHEKERISSFDDSIWQKYLKILSEKGTIGEVSKVQGMPSKTMVRQKLREDNAFKKQYDNVVSNMSWRLRAKRGDLPEEFTNICIELSSNGMLQKDIAKKLGVQKMTISRHLNK
jgi:hypothetical protein